MDDVFEKIISGELPSEKIYEDDMTYAFLDIHPSSKGHSLVVPKTKSRNIFDISPTDLGAVMETVRKLAPVIRKAVGAEGINIQTNNESAAGQVVFYTHVHIIPRFPDDGLRLWPKIESTDEERREIAEKIRSKLSL
jgi:histidine triad (HIT) family protein